MNKDQNKTNIAIACQGGGSHTAFTAGVLKSLLNRWDEDRFELVGLSGTSGGAFNALAVWYGMVTEDKNKSIDILDGLWQDMKASSISEKIMNDFLVNFSHIESRGFPIVSLSPYDIPFEELGKKRIKNILEKYIDFEDIPDLCKKKVPELVVGTVNVNAGEFETFKNKEVTIDAILASSAVPNLYRGVEIHGHLHWDGLFSQNPPINDLMEVNKDRKPEEIWIIQINPQKRKEDPTSLEEIADRRNELSGNISLNQEIRFIEKVNKWIERGDLSKEKYSKIKIRRIQMKDKYHSSTKVDRSQTFINELLSSGEIKGEKFIENIKN